jgi:hypothetical protein
MESIFTWQTGLVLVAFLVFFRPLGKAFLKLLPKQPPAPPKTGGGGTVEGSGPDDGTVTPPGGTNAT